MKIRVGILFGGVSVEHEVSVISGLQALHALDENIYEAIPIYITKEGIWYTGAALKNIDAYKNLAALLNECETVRLVREAEGKFILEKTETKLFGKKQAAEIDVAFPVTHGTTGEDGILQGFLQLLGIPFVGPDVLSSAIGMDKVVMKNILRDSGLPIVKHIWFYKSQWLEDQEAWMQKAEEEIGYPIIVKPANLGSSVGISKAKNRADLESAVDYAAQFAHKLLLEAVVEQLTEINCSVLGDQESAEASVCEEVLGNDEILSYKDKYEGNSSKGMSGASRKIPAEISEEKTKEIQSLAKEVFYVLGCTGVARIDFLLDTKTEKVYVNEINSIPGSLSFYLWEPTGKSFTELVDILVKLALKRTREQLEISYAYDSNLFAIHGGTKGKLGAKGTQT